MSILNRKPPPLDVERVNNIRDEIDAFIDARVAVLKKTSPGVPELGASEHPHRRVVAAASALRSFTSPNTTRQMTDLKAQQKAAKV